MSSELEKLVLELRSDILSLRSEIVALRAQVSMKKRGDIDTSSAGDADAGGAAIAVDRGSDVDQEN